METDLRAKLKIAIICKGVDDFEINSEVMEKHKPKNGDVAVFEVLDIGKHKAIQGVNGNNRYIFPGDHVMLAFGARYATEQLEGIIPNEFCDTYQILGKGGAVGIMRSMHSKLLKKGPTNLRMVGYSTKDGKVVNTRFLNYKRSRFNSTKKRKSKVILSLGAAMDSGKTTTAAYLCRGLSKTALTAYFKMTGTVYAKDRSLVRDCGACYVSDFSIMGYPSTYMCPKPQILDIYESLHAKMKPFNPVYTIVEIADGLMQRETAALLQDPKFINTIHSIIFSGGDSMSTMLGYQILTSYGIKPAALSGLFTASPMLVSEVVPLVDIPILTLDTLSSADVVDIFKESIFDKK